MDHGKTICISSAYTAPVSLWFRTAGGSHRSRASVCTHLLRQIMRADVDGCSLFAAVDDVPLLLALVGGGVLDALPLGAASSDCEAFFFRAMAFHSLCAGLRLVDFVVKAKNSRRLGACSVRGSCHSADPCHTWLSFTSHRLSPLDICLLL